MNVVMSTRLIWVGGGILCPGTRMYVVISAYGSNILLDVENTRDTTAECVRVFI